MLDIAGQLKAIHREVGKRPAEAGEEVGVLLSRTYDTSAEDLWSAMTDPERIRRWFYPISGDLRVGGNFQLEGNAGGEILTCEPPTLLRVTFGGPTSVVELRLSPDGEGTQLELEHTVPIAMAGSGAGALYVGPGWDGAFLGLSLFVDGVFTDDPAAAALSPEALEFSRRSVEEWTAAVEVSGTASAEELAAARQVSIAQFAPADG